MQVGWQPAPAQRQPRYVWLCSCAILVPLGPPKVSNKLHKLLVARRDMIQALRNVGGGLAASLLSLAYCFSYGAFIFTGPLQPFLSQGVAAALITAAVTATIVALTSGFRSAVAGPESNTTALFAAMMVILAPTMAAMEPHQALALAMAALGIATLLTGLSLFLLGWWRLGKMVRFIPYPVVAGFLAATGWLMISGAVTMATGVPLSWQTLPSFTDPHTLPVLGTTILWAGTLWSLTARWKYPLVLPLALIGATLATHAVLATLPLPDDLTATSAIMFSLPSSGRPAFPLVTGEYFRADWAALVPVAGDMAAIAVMAILAILLNSTSVELATKVDIDLDRELRVQGIANVASACAGGFVGHISVSRTLVNFAAGGARAAGVVVGLVALAVLIFGSQAISYIPRFVLAGLLFQLGARFVWDWGLRSRRSLPLLDWLVVVAIVLITSNFGFLQALLFGLLAGCVIFAVDVSRIRVIRHQFGLDTRSSSLVRSRGETAFLTEHGGQVQVLELSGYLFFGSAYSVLERVMNLVAERRLQEMIFDFSGVTGIDSSAGASFAKIRDLLKKNGIRQAMVAMSPMAANILNIRASLDESVRCPDNLDTALEEAEETVLATSEVPVGLHRSMVDWLTEVVGSRKYAQALFDRMMPAPRDSSSYLCRQGDPTDSLLFIERGPVTVTLEMRDHPPLRVRVFGTHTLVGEVGFFLDVPRSANLLAAPGAIVWSLSHQAFDEFMRAHPEEALALTTYVIRLQSERLTFANRQIASLQR
jgi:sulfate permease, SulP family